MSTRTSSSLLCCPLRLWFNIPIEFNYAKKSITIYCGSYKVHIWVQMRCRNLTWFLLKPLCYINSKCYSKLQRISFLLCIHWINVVLAIIWNLIDTALRCHQWFSKLPPPWLVLPFWTKSNSIRTCYDKYAAEGTITCC
jgi:hypothetical protein